jgi:hypothetical protein
MLSRYHSFRSQIFPRKILYVSEEIGKAMMKQRGSCALDAEILMVTHGPDQWTASRQKKVSPASNLPPTLLSSALS